jgi:hypothetical protein
MYIAAFSMHARFVSFEVAFGALVMDEIIFI